MDAVMQLAREASNHQYLPASEHPPASGAQDSTNGRSEDTEGHASQTRSAGAEGSTSGGVRGRRKAASTASYARGGRKRKQSQRVSPPFAKPEQDQQPATEQPQEEVAHEQQADSTDDQLYKEDSSLKASDAAWMQGRTDSQQDQQQRYNMYNDSGNMGGPSNLVAATAAAAAAAAAATANSHRHSLSAEGGEAEHHLEGSAPSQFSSPTNRSLSSTKRAAQNRAAQRAFRERRDKHVKELEMTAIHFAQIQTDYATLQTRYTEAIALIDHLRRENEALRGIREAGGKSEHSEYSHGKETTEAAAATRPENSTEGLEAVASAAAGAARLAAASELGREGKQSDEEQQPQQQQEQEQ